MIIIPIGDINQRKKIPYVNYTLIGLNIIIFVVLSLRPDYPRLVWLYGLIPAYLEPLDLITSMFLHGSIWHLLGNMLYLWICGDNVEDRLGHVGYLAFYLWAGIVAGLTHSFMVNYPIFLSPFSLFSTNPRAEIPCIGASGAIAGVIGAYAFFFPRSKIKFVMIIWLIVLIIPSVFYLASGWAIGFWFIMQLMLAYLETIRPIPQGIAYWAHIGGFLSGLTCVAVLSLIGLIPRRKYSRYRR